MSSFPKEWPFLTEAWKFALVLSGRESAATELVSGTLAAISKRPDLHEVGRTKRIFFSMLCREGAKFTGVSAPETPTEQAVYFLHQLPEPSRKAMALLCLGVFSGEHLAGLLGQSEAGLARCLDEARARLRPQFAPPTP